MAGPLRHGRGFFRRTGGSRRPGLAACAQHRTGTGGRHRNRRRAAVRDAAVNGTRRGIAQDADAGEKLPAQPGQSHRLWTWPLPIRFTYQGNFAMKKLAVVYHSANGHTEHIASHIAQGAASVTGTEVHVLKASELAGAPEALLQYDGVLLGSPTYLGGVSGVFKSFMDATGKMW